MHRFYFLVCVRVVVRHISVALPTTTVFKKHSYNCHIISSHSPDNVYVVLRATMLLLHL